jgi:hypothetical protein
MKTLLWFGTGSKLLPEIVIVAPMSAGEGDTPLIVGAAIDATVKPVPNAAIPEGEDTETGPLAAPEGTATVICVGLTVLGVAAWPLKLTVVFAVVPKPVPKIVTTVPAGPRLGVSCATIASVIGLRTTERMFPTAS